MRLPYKEKILQFLMENKGKRFSCVELSKKLEISYSTALKWVEVLAAEKKIKTADYGNIKLVWIDEGQNLG